MCGIFCIYNSKGVKSSAESFDKALSLIRHRGPDSSNSLFFDECYIGSNRLRVRDLDPRADMPLTLRSGQACISYNGNIYNNDELREELIALGHLFQTNSDTETILKAYLQYGFGFEKKLRGMFSIVIWNNNDKRLIVSRDRFGIKPLFKCTLVNGDIIYSSELGPIIFMLGGMPRLNAYAVKNYILEGSCDVTDSTIFEHCKRLSPSITHVHEDSREYSYIYYNLQCNPEGSVNRADFNQLIDHTFKKHFEADVRTSILLSSGIDSTGIAVCGMNNQNSPIAFTMIDSDSDSDEYKATVQTANNLGISLLPCEYSTVQALEDLPTLAEANIEPIRGLEEAYKFRLYREVSSNNIKVVLTGDGADEVYCSRSFINYYANYLLHCQDQSELIDFEKKTKFFQKGIENKSNFYKDFNLPPVKFSRHIRHFSDDLFNNRLHASNLIEQNSLLNAIKNSLFAGDLPWILRHQDRQSSFFGIEARVPYLDHKLIECYLSLPHASKMKHGISKFDLRSAFYSKKNLPVFLSEKKYRMPGCRSIFNSPSKELRDLTYESIYSLQNNVAIQDMDWLITLLNEAINPNLDHIIGQIESTHNKNLMLSKITERLIFLNLSLEAAYNIARKSI